MAQTATGGGGGGGKKKSPQAPVKVSKPGMPAMYGIPVPTKKASPKKAVPRPGTLKTNPLLPPALTGKPSPKQPKNITEMVNQAAGKPYRPAPVTIPKAPPKPAAKTAPRPPVGASGGRGGSAPLVGGGGLSPSVNPQVAGGGGKPGPSDKAKAAVEKNKSAVNGMQKFIDQAKASIGAQDLPALNELQRQLDEINATYGKQKGETEQRGKAMQSDLAELFGRLGNFTRQVKSQTDAQFQGLQQQGGQQYADLQGQLGKTFGAATQDVESELARMGMSGQAPNATADLGRDSAFLRGLAGADSAHLKGAFGLQQGGFDQLMGMAQNNAATEGSVQVGRAKQATEQTLADLMFQMNNASRNVAGKRGDIIATQGQRTNELAMGLEDRDYARRSEEEQRQIANKIALERLAMDKESHALGMQPQPADYQDILRTTLLEQQVQADKYATEQAKKDAAWKAAVAAAGLPGKYS